MHLTRFARTLSARLVAVALVGAWSLPATAQGAQRAPTDDGPPIEHAQGQPPAGGFGRRDDPNARERGFGANRYDHGDGAQRRGGFGRSEDGWAGSGRGGSGRGGSGRDGSGRNGFASGASGSDGDFDFYVLALSWSASFCESGGAQKGRRQCAPGAAHGFVLHGLWPQYERGHPSDCAADRPLSRAVIDAHPGLFPDEGLARYQWRKHGTCSGKGPSAYFADVRRARDMVRVPEQFAAPRQEARLAPIDVLRAFQDANPRLRPGMAAVGCQRGLLQEVRVCLSRDLRDFRPCPEVVRLSCRARDIRVPAPR